MAAINKFPKNPINNQLFVDNNNMQWIYNRVQAKWNQNKLFDTIQLVSSTNNGIITPNDYIRLVELEQSLVGLSIPSFKISPGVDAYYYYFYSPDGLIDIRYRGDGVIAIDVNEQKLVSYLWRNICIGDIGPTGDVGDVGEDGVPSSNEQLFYPIKTNSTLTGEVYVPIPIGTYLNNPTITSISLRLFELYSTPDQIDVADQLLYWISGIGGPLVNIAEKNVFAKLRQALVDQALGSTNGNQIVLSNLITSKLILVPIPLLELDINPTNNSYIITSNKINVNGTNIYVDFNKDLGLLKFSITASWPKDVVFKAKQRGPNGDRGDIPSNYISVVECVFPNDSNVRPDNFLTDFRIDCENDVFYASYDKLPSQKVYDLISTDPLAAATATKTAINGRYVAVERIAGPIKNTSLLQAEFPELSADEPDFQNWEPQPGCFTKRSFDNHEFDWISGTTSTEVCPDIGLRWFGPEGVRPSTYPYQIVKPIPPAVDECCQDDFFIFPETGDC